MTTATAKRTLIATDVPFWRASTGAQQRIRSLVNCLVKQKLQLRLFVIATDNPSKLRAEIASISELQSPNLSIEVHASSDPPQQLGARLGWHLAGTLNLLSSKKNKPGSGTLRLADFNWPWAASKFAETVAEFQPDSIIIEYVTLAYLLDAIDTRTKPIQTIVDTHDMLHKRYQDFKERGAAHWIAIEAAEEAAVLNRFDTVIAIQPLEAEQMARMAPSANVIVCKHACFADGPHPNVDSFQQTDDQRKLSFGILASNNPANCNAITNFINDVWLPNYSATQNIQLTIAGSVCTGLESNRPKIKSIVWAPELNSTERFYRHIDVVVNPIEFGAGLKIKNVEAIAYGKPLITTSHGATGFIEAPHASILVVDAPERWRAAIERLSDLAEITCTGKLARQLSADQFSDTAAYGPLLKQVFES